MQDDRIERSGTKMVRLGTEMDAALHYKGTFIENIESNRSSTSIRRVDLSGDEQDFQNEELA